MSGIVLRPRASLEARVDLTGIVPDKLAGLGLSEIEHLSVPHGGRSATLADLFFVSRAPDGVVVIEIGDERLDHVGAGMAAGEIFVDGPVGAWAGLAMSDGILRISGNAGDFAGAELSGGRIDIAGNAGGHAGGASSGSRRGLSGGVLRIAGSVGTRAAARQRGGLIVVLGNAGDGLATDMIAGTTCVHGTLGALTGRGMKRGTVLCRNAPELPAGFVDTGTHDLIALRLLSRRVAELGEMIGAATSARRLVGDTLLGGQGEVLVV